MQNLAASNTDFETLFSEARKFSVGVVTANQFLAQLPPTMRSAIQAISTHVFFELSPEDAVHVAQEIGGGKPVAERLRTVIGFLILGVLSIYAAYYAYSIFTAPGPLLSLMMIGLGLGLVLLVWMYAFGSPKRK
jgi:hypothetical protein